MSNPPDTRGLLLGAVGLAVGLVVGYAAHDAARPNPAERNLDACLWLQTSGEFHALSLQTYRLAAEKLAARLDAYRAEPQANGRPGPAVVMDLDETVFDNSPFQTWSYRDRVPFVEARWEVWERDCPEEVRLVPGARGFIESAERAGVAVVYLSNRLEKHRAATVRALRHLGLSRGDPGPRLLLRTGASDKTQRRRQVEARYRVLMNVGDNLRDFSEEFRAPPLAADAAGQNRAVARRKRQVEAHAARFGDDWFILPNPVYGEWERLVGRRPLDVLNPKSSRRAGPEQSP